MTAAHPRFPLRWVAILGAIDPEMLVIMRALRAAGAQWEWARPAGSTGPAATPLRAPAQAYACADVAVDPGVARVWVECRPAGASRADLEARGDIVFDHHDVAQDPCASAPPERAVAASSVGQIRGWAETAWTAFAGDLDDHAAGLYAAIDASLFRVYAVAGAMDHALGAALGGLVPGVDPDACLRAAAEMAADEERAALNGTPPEAPSPDAYLAQVNAAQEILRGARRVTLGGQQVCDLLGRAGKIPALPVAAAHARLAYVVETPARPGVPATCAIGGATTPAAVRVFAELAREAFALALEAARREAESATSIAADVWVLTPSDVGGVVREVRDGVAEVVLNGGLGTESHPVLDLRIDRRGNARLRELEAFASQGAARGGVYAFPERGMAGAYLPAALLAPLLRDEVERAFADLLAGDSAFSFCLQLAAEHATASGGATAELRDLRGLVRRAMDAAYGFGRVQG